MNKHLTSAFTEEQLARLLQIGQDSSPRPEGVSEAELVSEILRERLDGSLPLDDAVVDALPLVMRRVCRSLAPLNGKPLGDALLDKDTPLEMICRVKEHARRLADSLSPGPHRDLTRPAAVTLYYAAIASALVHHGEKITTHSLADLARSLRDLHDQPWMAPELKGLLARAADICERSASHLGT